MSAIVTLTTDFGLKDGFVGVMKGVIWGICPSAQIADISHQVAPQNVLEGALVLGRAFPYFPPGTVHLGVVDPGVGTARRPIAARLGDHLFVGPDNGIFTLAYEKADRERWPVRIVHLTRTSHFLPKISATFHGRDIFAPVAARLAAGKSLDEFGPALDDPRRLVLPEAGRIPGGWKAHIMGIDSFGNLATNLLVEELRAGFEVRVRLGRHEVQGLSRSYGEGRPRQLIALADSAGMLELAVVNGSAAELTGARVGDELEVLERS
jgi:S-adenosylmethionine hydrolase